MKAQRHKPVPTLQNAFQAAKLTGNALLLCLAASASAFGQATWEFSPYKVHCVVAFEVSPQFTPPVEQAVADSLVDRADAVFGPVWETHAEVAAGRTRDEIVGRLDALTPEDIQRLQPKWLANDKLYLCAVHVEEKVFRIQVRELDCRARYFSPSVQRLAAERDAVPLASWDAIATAFTPSVRVETVEGSLVTARLRAGGLFGPAQPAAAIDPGACLRLVVRRNDRLGEPAKGGVQLLPWTLLEVKERKDSLLTCNLVSGYRSVLPTKASQRTERIGLLAAPRYESTRLVLNSRARVPQPLAGYEIFLKGATEQETKRLGATDWSGSFELPRADGRLNVLLVRSGSQLLARLPLVPGQDPELVASVLDDDRRLQAEGFVQAFQSRIMDLVARREILAAQFRQRLAAGKLDEAKQLLEEYRGLETRADLNRALDGQLQEVVSPDKLTQQRIDRLFASARELLNRFLDPEQGNALSRELAAANKPVAAK